MVEVGPAELDVTEEGEVVDDTAEVVGALPALVVGVAVNEVAGAEVEGVGVGGGVCAGLEVAVPRSAVVDCAANAVVAVRGSRGCVTSSRTAATA